MESISDIPVDISEEEFDEQAWQDMLDEAAFGEPRELSTLPNIPPHGDELKWGDYFLNGRESGAGPDVKEFTAAELLNMGYTKYEIASAYRKMADDIEGNKNNEL